MSGGDEALGPALSPSLSPSLFHWIIQHMVNQPFVTDTETACRVFFMGAM